MAIKRTSSKQSTTTDDAKPKRAAKSTATKAKAKPAAKSKAKAAAKAKAKPRKQDDAAKAKRAEAKAAKEQARTDAISAGDIIVAKGGVEYHKTGATEGTMIDRANALLAELKKSATPITIKSLIAKHGGAHPQYLAMVSLLEAQGEVVKFRARGGDESGQVAFLHVSQAFGNG